MSDNAGTIKGVCHTPMSGIAELIVVTDDGKTQNLVCDAGPLFRALRASGAKPGTRITWEMTDWGTMAGFDVEGEN